MKKYIFAGIDFIMDNEGELYFLEANSSPGALKEYKKAYGHCRPLKELCAFLNKNFKSLAVISKKRWGNSKVSDYYKKKFNGLISVCNYKKNRSPMSKGDGSLINSKGEMFMPDVLLRVAAGKANAQEKAGLVVINPRCVTKITVNKIKAKRIVRKYTDIKVPKHFRVNKKGDIKKVLGKKKELFKKGFVLKPSKGQKSRGVFIFKDYKKIPKKFRIREPYMMEEIIQSSDHFRKEFFEIRSMAVNGKYAGSMLFVSKKRPLHLFKEGRVEKTPKRFEDKIKKATEDIVRAIDSYACGKR